MHKILSFLVCLGFVISFGAADAMAIGLGFGVNVGSGESDISIDGGKSTVRDLDMTTAGLVLDTNLSYDKLFNYRLTIGSTSAKIDGLSVEPDGFGMIHDFGFGLVTTDSFRLWMGPELRLAWIEGSSSTTPQADYELFSFGFGPVIGANFNIGSTVTIALTGAYVIQTTNGDIYSSLGWYDYEADDEYFALGAGLIFRLNE